MQGQGQDQRPRALKQKMCVRRDACKDDGNKGKHTTAMGKML